jgi:pyruvate/2-oxoglutarate dehydrogenase complex dihydrolipoamide dehydrogenase (E3) component
VLILGGGIVGTHAAKMAAGLGANVTIMDISLPRLRYLDDIMPANVHTMVSNHYNIREAVRTKKILPVEGGDVTDGNCAFKSEWCTDCDSQLSWANDIAVTE